MTKEKTIKSESKEKERTYYGKVAIVGPSGSGKSYLTKTADRETTGYINMDRQPLPYKSTPFKHEGRPKTWSGFLKNLRDYGENPEIERIIIDSQTFAFNSLNKEMSQNFSGYDVYKNFNKQVYEYLEVMKNIEKDILIISHDELLNVEGEKVKRMSVQGKEFEGKIEQHFSIVLYATSRIKEGKAEYFLKVFEPGTSAKVPEGLFGLQLEIPNDAAFIFNALEQYYSN